MQRIETVSMINADSQIALKVLRLRVDQMQTRLPRTYGELVRAAMDEVKHLISNSEELHGLVAAELAAMQEQRCAANKGLSSSK